MIDLSSRRALVCGATQGIGRACAELLAKLGARVTLVARDEAALRATSVNLTTSGGGAADWFAVDFADPSALRQRAERYVQEAGPVEILVNNTGGPPAGTIFDAAPEAFLKAFQMHVLGNQALAQTLVPGMKSRGYGRIINIISTSVREPIPGLGVSNTTRGAVASWAKTLSRELGPFGITVNNILPGYTETGRLDELIRLKAEKAGVSVEKIIADMKAVIPLGRFASPTEIASAVAFLASPAASYISGVSLAVDGGRTNCI
jgi:3-oxoacyl-[acyl-carrier protein] reductase